MIWLLLACSTEPDAAPARTSPTVITPAHSWVRTVATDATHVYWSNYDASSGRSARAVLERAPIDGGPAEEVAVEAHPPDHIAVTGGFLYWGYHEGSLKRVPVTGGEPDILMKDAAVCFSADTSGVYFIRGVELLHLDPNTKQTRTVAPKALGLCPLAYGDRVYWTERTGIFSVPKSGGTPEMFAKLKKAEGLLVFEEALYTCYDDRITRIDPQTGEHEPVRGMCKGDGIEVSTNAHWFRTPYYAGWPPQKYLRIVEVTSEGPSWLYDGLGASPPKQAGGKLLWFGRDKDSSAWNGLSVPLPEKKTP